MQEGRHGERLSKHPSNSRGSKLVCPAVTVKGHAGSSPGLGALGCYSEQQGKLYQSHYPETYIGGLVLSIGGWGARTEGMGQRDAPEAPFHRAFLGF